MKKLLVAIIMIAGFSGMAQKREMKSNHRTTSDFTPEQVATLQTKKMTLHLDLSNEQQAKMKTMLLDDAKARKANMETRKANKEENKTLSASEKYTRQNERLDQQLARKKEMKSLLTPEQYAKWEKTNHHRGKKGRRGAQSRKSRNRK